MIIEKQTDNSLGKQTMLTLNVAYTCSIMSFLFSIFCYFYLGITGIIFKVLLVYSILNSLNILFFFKHKKLIITYNVMSILAFVATYLISLNSGGVNSPFASFLVLIIFSGYASSRFYGNLWLVVISLAAISLYIISVSKYEFPNYVGEEASDAFNFFFLLFLIILLGGVFGRLMNKNNEKVYLAKKEIAQRNEEKAIMLKEIHHRVKNNLHVVNSLLRIQSRGIEDCNVKMMFKIAQSRIVAMARLHEKIYNTNNLKNINVKDHFRELISDLISSYNIDVKIAPKLNIEPVKISIDSLLPLSLIINELITNSLKHAFVGKNEGEIYVDLIEVEKNKYVLSVGDNGVGVAGKFFSELKNSTGARLVRTFVRQIKGKIDVIDEGEGSRFKILFTDEYR